MRRARTMVLWTTALMYGSVVIDRIAVIVDKHAIKTSDIMRDLRATGFLNGAPPDFTPAARRKAAERLIDQTIIRDEIQRGEYARSSAADLQSMLGKLLQNRFGGSSLRMNEELARYGLTGEQLRMQLQWQLDVLQFIEERFRPAVLVTDDEVRAYYAQHEAALKRQFPQAKTYEALEPKIRASLEGERVNTSFENWLAQARKRCHIEYLQEAFQ
jgi:hypothetical protein